MSTSTMSTSTTRTSTTRTSTMSTTTTTTSTASATATAPPRVDLLTHVHVALRHGLFDVTHRLGATDWADPAAARAAAAAWEELDVQLTSHARHEDEHIFALLDATRPGATTPLAAEHDRVHERQRETGAAIAAAATSLDPAHGLEAYRTMTRFVAEYLAHALDEERHLLPALWDACTDDELLACRRALLATVPPEEAAVTQRWLLVSIDRSTRARLLAGARASLPPEAFARLLSLARAVLAADDVQHLEASLAATAADGSAAA